MLRSKRVYWASFLLLLGCSSEATNPVDEESSVEQSLTSGDVMGFEVLGGWSATAGTLSLQTTHTQGRYALGVANFSYTELKSTALGTPSRVTPKIGFDLMLPTYQPNPYWLGQVQLYVDVPSQNINNLMIGQKDLTGSPLGRFFTVSLPITTLVATRLQYTSYTDLKFRIVLNVPRNTAVYRLDNLRFLPDPAAGPVRHTDVFLMQDISMCAIGDPCPDWNADGTCYRFYDDAGVIRDAVAANDNFRTVAPSDPARYTAPHAVCQRDVLTPTQVTALRAQLAAFRENIYNWSSGSINLSLDIHEIGPVEMPLSGWGYGFWVGPWNLQPVAQPYLSRDTDFVLVSQGIRDPSTGLHHDVGGCGGTFGVDWGLAGAGYSWIPATGNSFWFECADSGVYAHEWAHQLDFDLDNLSGFSDLYHDQYPACGQCASDPYTWFPNPDGFCSDPDLPTCGQDPCASDNNQAVSHLLEIHYNPAQRLIANHCKDGMQDFDESGVDVGGDCLSAVFAGA